MPEWVVDLGPLHDNVLANGDCCITVSQLDIYFSVGSLLEQAAISYHSPKPASMGSFEPASGPRIP
jgi:hypothetical protein